MNKFDTDTMNALTDRARNERDVVLYRALSIFGDPNKTQRLAERACTVCFYLRRGGLSGQAFTAWSCLNCEQLQPEWHNTAHPRLCEGCAKKLNCCQKCGADMDLRSRMKQMNKRR